MGNSERSSSRLADSISRLFGCLAAGALLAASPPDAVQAYEPIYVIFNYHLDPLGPNPTAAQISYVDHRDSVSWATSLALSTGVKVSAASSGPYAEACLLNGHDADFGTFMPGEQNALGVHMHAHRKLAGFLDYEWQDVGAGEQPLLLTAEVFDDQISFVNQIYTALGFTASDNDLFHGSHAITTGSLDELYSGGVPPFTYPNTFSVLGGTRGLYHPYRTGAGPDEDLNGNYVRIPYPGGIAGVDQLHGPEGMLYGTLPYLRKDFILDYLEWRYAQSNGLTDRIWVFGWGSHPYQTTPIFVGTDGIPIRQTIEDLLTWLNEDFIEQPSAEGNVIARYANYREVYDRFIEWELLHPGTSSIDGDDAGPNHQLSATAGALATSYYETKIAANPDVEIHEFTDREDATVRYVVWSDLAPQTLDLSGQLTGLTAAIDHTGTVTFADAADQNIGGDPVVILAATLGDADVDGDQDLDDHALLIPCMAGPDSTPVDPACAIFDFESDGHVDLEDVASFQNVFTASP